MQALLSTLTLASLVAALQPALAAAAEPPNVTYAPAPPGTLVQSRVVYLAGEAMHSQWRAVASKKRIGVGDNGDTFFAWYLSIYAIDGSTYRLKYRSPTDGGPLTAVAKAHGANMWFPVQSLTLVGAAELMQPGVQQLVVSAHEFAADCGSSTVTVLGYDPDRGKVVSRATVTNGCELNAMLVTSANGAAIRLTGPYYGPNAALCCPTKPKAVATLRYANGAWSETPKYFPLKTR